MLAHAAGLRREDLIARPDLRPDPEIASRFRDFIERREGREPVAYILGRREFWSLEFRVNRTVLVPRPETETLVGEVLRRLPPPPPESADRDRRTRVIDLGTGSGNVALSLASEWADLFIVATDLSGGALRTAKENAARLGMAGRVEFAGADWLEGIRPDGSFDAVVSNPPYIREGEEDALDRRTLAFEPRAALIAGADGLDACRAIVRGAEDLLRPGGWLLLEIGADQAAEVRGLLEARGVYGQIDVVADLAGRDRVVAARREGG